MGTNHVKKGANRASSYGKRAKASQAGTMLPPRTPEAEAARAVEIAEARVIAAKTAGERAMARADLEFDKPFAIAYEWKWTGEANGWAATMTTGWASDGHTRTATVIFTRDGERLAVSWKDGEPDRYPLLSERDGVNVRLATHADALYHLTH